MSRIEQALLQTLNDKSTPRPASRPRAPRPDPGLRLVTSAQPSAHNPYVPREIRLAPKPRLSAPAVQFAQSGAESAAAVWDEVLTHASALGQHPNLERVDDQLLVQASALARARGAVPPKPGVTSDAPVHIDKGPVPGPATTDAPPASHGEQPVVVSGCRLVTAGTPAGPAGHDFTWVPVQAYTQAGGAILSTPVAVEQFRKLAGQMIRAQELHGVKVVTVTSALQGEGKSVTSSSLALTLANSYKRDVLLVDADMRLPSLEGLFQLPGGYGLSDLLAQGCTDQVSPYQVSPMLAVLTAGRPTKDPVGALTSSRMRAFIEAASGRYDFVVIDTPPVAVLPDANLLGSMVDAVLLVIKAGDTQYEFVSRAVEAIKKERILGVVLNHAEQGSALRAYQYSKY